MKNRILKLLPVKGYRTILSQLKTVDLAQSTVLYEAGERIQEVYFPDEATIFYLSGTAGGETLEVCVIGNEGVVGIPSLLTDSTAFRSVFNSRVAPTPCGAMCCGKNSSDARLCINPASLYERSADSNCSDCCL
jgi:hypothetical protein